MATDVPELSEPFSPSISCPIRLHVDALYSHTRTCPEFPPAAPLFVCAPIATIDPSEDMATEYPDSSPAFSASISEPIWVHVDALYSHTRTCPASYPVPWFLYAPIATLDPSEDMATSHPEWSPVLSPSISCPIWVHVVPT